MNTATFEDAFNLLCGDKLGNGAHRTVYTCKIRHDLVVKVESDDFRYFANVMEMKFWSDHEHYEKVSRWLAPCTHLSPDGRILLQRRVDPLPSDHQMPPKVPSFLTDLKRENFGILDGQLVCIDYAMTIPNPNVRLKGVFWD